MPQQNRTETPEFVVHVNSSGPTTLLTNAFLVETSRSVVVVDAMMTVSDARALRARADAIEKPLVAVIITHGHPDHYNGVTELIRGRDNVRIIATKGVDEVIHRIDDAKEIQWKPIFGDDWPAQRTFPNEFVKHGDQLFFDGVPFTVCELGPGESHWDTYWLVGTESRVAFVGDLVFNGVHSFMNDGHTAQWLKSLDVLETELAGVEMVYTGHGMAAPPQQCLEAQRRYIKHYRKVVFELAGGASSLSDDAKTELKRAMTAFLDTDALDVFITAGADAIAAELATETASAGA
ncbi:MAG: MBL fold metallo-hydrolase [Proteobacteria bacterium]|nr:MBL fold metallo-hydrolase [Pseudomonadota bacterium]